MFAVFLLLELSDERHDVLACELDHSGGTSSDEWHDGT
jgi:hypothetical protein